MTVKFIVEGEPFAKQRPKATAIGGHIRLYSPSKTVDYENYIKLCYYRDAKNYYFGEAPLEMDILACKSIPKSFSKKRQQQALDLDVVPTTKPDYDNTAKIVCDALNGIAYHDDKQIIKATFFKIYAEKPKLCVIIRKYENKKEYMEKWKEKFIEFTTN